MPEARDRISRSEDVAEIFIRRRRSLAISGVLANEPEVYAVRSADEERRSEATRSGGATRAYTDTGRVRYRRRRSLYGSPGVSGRQNTPKGSGRQARVSKTVPSWYPRKPLHDITTVVRAFESTRARLRDMEGQQPESPLSHGQFVGEPSASSSTAPPEQNLRPFVGKVSKILHEISTQQAEEYEFLTPQRKLLNSIDRVEKVVLDEISRSKKTPAAKKAERAKKVRTLMSMR